MKSSKTAERLTLLVVAVIFAIEVAVLAYKGVLPPPWFVLFIGLAAYRGGRAVSYNTIFLPLRDLVGIVAEPDSSGAGDSTEVGEDVHGLRWVLAELILCPICSGQWVAMFCLALYAFNRTAGEVFIYALASAGIAEVVHWYAEHQEWAGRNHREQAGTQWLDKNERAVPPAQPKYDGVSVPFEVPFSVEELEAILQKAATEDRLEEQDHKTVILVR